MRILITNDDGFDAPGLHALAKAASQFGDVTIVAPDRCHSSKGHAVETKNTIHVESRSHTNGQPLFVTTGSPADCVRIGAHALMENPPDLVLAGINPGANLGVDLFYSGTVAAAREAAILGIPAVAVSQFMRPECPLRWDWLSVITVEVLKELDPRSLKAGEFWNINFPALRDGEQPRDLRLVPHSTETQTITFEVASRQGDRTEFRFTGDYGKRPAEQEADVRLLFAGHITATKVGLQMGIRDPS